MLGFNLQREGTFKHYVLCSNVFITLSSQIICRALSRPVFERSQIIPCVTGWSGGAKVLGKPPVPGRPTIRMIVGQWPTALTVGAGAGGLDIFTLIYPFSPLAPSLWETARYRLKYCLKGPLNPKQPTNQPLRNRDNVSNTYTRTEI